MFDSVSILFSDIVTFTEICSRITPMEVVSMLNAMYSIFDTLTERNKVYKVTRFLDILMYITQTKSGSKNYFYFFLRGRAQLLCNFVGTYLPQIKSI